MFHFKTKTISTNFLISALIFFLVMTVYIFTLAPTITVEDSGELVTAAYTLGIAHPPGFPLYVILGKLFTFIPLGTIAWRVNLMSAFFGALTASLVYLGVNKVIRNKIIAFAGALILAFSPTFWSQSVIAEVYTLNTFLISLLILILLTWSAKRNVSYLYWFSFLYGLTLTNHTATILIAPAFTLYILLTDKTIITNWKLIGKMFILFLTGLLVYLFIPLRAYQQTSFNWSGISTWTDVLNHITRAQYNDFAPFSNNYSKTGIALSFFVEIYKQFFLPTLFLASGGAVYLWKKNKAFFWLTVGIFFLNSFGVIYLRKWGWNIGIDYTYRVYYLPVYIVVIFWLAIIFNYLIQFINRILEARPSNLFRLVKVLLYIIILSLPASFLYMNYENNDYSDYWLTHDFASNLLESLEPNSIYYFTYDGSLQGDTELFSLLYLKKVENMRPDVTIVSEQQFFYKEVRLGLPPEYFKLGFEPRRRKIFELLRDIEDRPIFTNFAVTRDYFELDMFSLSNGYVFKLYQTFDEAYAAAPSGQTYPLRGLTDVDEFTDYGTAGLVAHHFYDLAYFYLTKGYPQKAQDYLIQAFNLDTAPFNHEYTRFLEYRYGWNKKDNNI